ncbi:Uma2 family endonuclease [Sporomusa sp.]|uniref:Uma2 family endonuclease n=1 Tax=Sporomusa sp. TaxID=2078658 RepID=UPI002BDDFD09|nr:Uma2 family endonuclease [Sporomusa sp.]HWR43047.1 Uma2 family endonuclease [Sporomusa sp.]
MSDMLREAIMPYSLPDKKIYTYEDYAKLPEGAGYQLVGGEIIVTPAPGRRHQRLVLRLVKLFDDYVECKNLGEVAVAPRDVYLGPHETYQPDILFIAKDRIDISAEDKVNGAPDLIVEILSPSTAYYDLRKKYRVYEKYGVKEYWIVDPEEKSIEIYNLTDGQFHLTVRQVDAGETASSLLPGFTVHLDILFKDI